MSRKEHWERVYQTKGPFAPGGPEKCSGLPVMRYSPETLGTVLEQGFRLLESIEETHSTPWNTDQAFSYTRWLRGK